MLNVDGITMAVFINDRIEYSLIMGEYPMLIAVTGDY